MLAWRSLRSSILKRGIVKSGSRNIGSNVCYELKTVDPYLNLAFEEYLLYTSNLSDSKVLMLWQNQPTVVLGRFQNVWHEVNLNVLKNSQAHTHVARRESGGGCVYHDLGNCNLTFFSLRHLPYENLQIVQNALATLGYDATINQTRHEILLGQKKISGSAFRITGKDKACYHHCTMLIHSDLSHLNKILSSHLSAESYATQSVRSHVTNLQQINTKITIPTFFDAMKESFIKFHGKPLKVMPILNEEEMLNIPRVSESYNKFKSWDWIYGQTPKFTTTLTNHFPYGSLSISLSCDKGEFHSVDVTIDSKKNAFTNMLENTLSNKNIGELSNYTSTIPYDPFETDEQEAEDLNEKMRLFFKWFLKFW